MARWVGLLALWLTLVAVWAQDSPRVQAGDSLRITVEGDEIGRASCRERV